MKKFACILIAIIVLGAAVVVGVWQTGIDKDKLIALINTDSFDAEFSSQEATPFSLENFNELTSDLKKAYIQIFRHIRNHPKYIKVPIMTRAEFSKVFFAVKNDNPDLLCFADSCNMTTFLSHGLLELKYDYSVTDCERMHSELKAKSDEIANKANELYGTDFERELYIHDYIVNNTEYVETSNSANAYGCLVEGKAVCSGYSRACMLLLGKCSIRSVLVGGKGISETQGNVDHMWNVVWLEGVPYNLDVTWDDPLSNEGTSAVHIYFNMPDSVFSKNHLDASPKISCTDDRHNFFKYYDILYSQYNNKTVRSISNRLNENLSNGLNYVEFMFDNKAAYDDACNGLLNSSNKNSDIYYVLRNITDSSSEKLDLSYMNFSTDEDLYYIRIFFNSKDGAVNG